MANKDSGAHAALVKAAAELGLPTRFASDLHTHDAAILARRPNEAFAWVVGNYGTHLSFASNRDARTLLKCMQEAVQIGDGAQAFWFVWDGYSLHTCESADHAYDRLNAPKCSYCDTERHPGFACT
jgi:hypothetical protein